MIHVAVLLLAGQAANTLGEQAVRATHDRFQAAVVASDTRVLADLLAPEYVFMTATGDVFNRDDVLRIYGARELAHTTYRADSVRVRMLNDDAAVVTAVLVKQSRYVRGPRAGTEVAGRYRSTRVYVRRDGRWQVVSTHESRIEAAQPLADPGAALTAGLDSGLHGRATPLLERFGDTFYVLGAYVTSEGETYEFTSNAHPPLNAPPSAWLDSVRIAALPASVRAVGIVLDLHRITDAARQDSTFARLWVETRSGVCRSSLRRYADTPEGRVRWETPVPQPCSRQLLR